MSRIPYVQTPPQPRTVIIPNAYPPPTVIRSTSHNVYPVPQPQAAAFLSQSAQLQRLQNVTFAPYPHPSRVAQPQGYSSPYARPYATEPIHANLVAPSQTNTPVEAKPTPPVTEVIDSGKGDSRYTQAHYQNSLNHGVEQIQAVPTREVNPASTTQRELTRRDPDPKSLTHEQVRTGFPVEQRDFQGIPATSPTPGLVGLLNIGNTCFINSTLQCLLNLQPLKDFFIIQFNVSDINANPPSKGDIARALHDLFSHVWKGLSTNPISPLMLKSAIGRIAPRFSGYSQQDAHEFLRFLLDGLHTDLNRVKEKPTYIERKNDSHIEDSEKSSIYWNDHIRFHNSIINDLFCGQLKSTTTCQKCHSVSSSFDPFMDLSLPIPEENRKARFGLGSLGLAQDIHMSDCFNKFMKLELLDGNDQYS